MRKPISRKSPPSRRAPPREAPLRLQKFLANRGVGSRREIEAWIEAGRLKVDGHIATLGVKVTEQSRLSLDNKPLKLRPTALKPQTKVLIYHKPPREMCTRNDPEGRPTVFDKLPMKRGSRWIQIGRLDFMTEGLLLFTDDGELAHRLMHPKYGMERDYAVRVFGKVKPEILETLKTGVMLEDGPAQFTRIIDAGGDGANHWYHVSIAEGRNREIRRLWESQGLTVSRLIRIRFGDIELPRLLKLGMWSELPSADVDKLKKTVGL